MFKSCKWRPSNQEPFALVVSVQCQLFSKSQMRFNIFDFGLHLVKYMHLHWPDHNSDCNLSFQTRLSPTFLTSG